MVKGRYDNRTWVEVVADLIIERSSVGDSIKLLITYAGSQKPTVRLEFKTLDPDKARPDNIVDITGWVDDSPYYDIIDDSTGRPVEGDYRRGSSSWKEYIDSRFGPLLQSMVKSGGRNFSYEVEDGK
jgi:hypothetical protein